MRKFFYATAALSVLLATLMAANAAEVPPYASGCASSLFASAVHLDWILHRPQPWRSLEPS
jgi:hypothetical protein